MPVDDMNANLSSLLLFSFHLIPTIILSISPSMNRFDRDTAKFIYKVYANVSSRTVEIKRVDFQCPVVRPDLVSLRNSSSFKPNLPTIVYWTFTIDTYSYVQNDSSDLGELFFHFVATDYSTPPNTGKELSLSKMMTPTLIIALVTVCFLFLVFHPHSRNMRMIFIYIMIVPVMVCFFILLLLPLIWVVVGATFWTRLRTKRTGNDAEEQQGRANRRHIDGLPRRFSFEEVFRATNGFSDEEWSGQGWVGLVSKGMLGCLLGSLKKNIFSCCLSNLFW